jgi:polyisoprenoid-binding protein YceI
MISKVQGGFEKMSGKLSYDPTNPEKSAIEVEIEAASVNTRLPERDNHLRGSDFFDTEKYPLITFKSKRVDSSENGLKVVGDLSIHGVTQQIVLDVDEVSEEVKDPWGNYKLGASGSAKIKRKDFGLVWNAALETGGMLVGDDVNIKLDVEFTRQA